MVSKETAYDIIFRDSMSFILKIYFLSKRGTFGCNNKVLGGEGTGKDELTFLMHTGFI